MIFVCSHANAMLRTHCGTPTSMCNKLHNLCMLCSLANWCVQSELGYREKLLEYGLCTDNGVQRGYPCVLGVGRSELVGMVQV